MKKLLIKIICIIQILLIPIISNAAFYDMEYGPDSKGKADYSDEIAEQDQLKEENTESSIDYVGKSSNNYLKFLEVENGVLSPEFNRQYLNYNVELKNKSDKQIRIIAETEDEKATVEGSGTVELKDGMNDIQVVVKAENGDVQIYDLYVNVPVQGNDEDTKSTTFINVERENEKTDENKGINKKYIILVLIITILVVVIIIVKKRLENK